MPLVTMDSKVNRISLKKRHIRSFIWNQHFEQKRDYGILRVQIESLFGFSSETLVVSVLLEDFFWDEVLIKTEIRNLKNKLFAEGKSIHPKVKDYSNNKEWKIRLIGQLQSGRWGPV